MKMQIQCDQPAAPFHRLCQAVLPAFFLEPCPNISLALFLHGYGQVPEVSKLSICHLPSPSSSFVLVVSIVGEAHCQ
jgi:hypothetical protein